MGNVFNIKDEEFLIVEGEFSVGDEEEDCDCCAGGCCPLTREITLTGLQGLFAPFNGPHTLRRVGAAEFNGVACCYEKIIEYTEAECLAALPCWPGGDTQIVLSLCVSSDGLVDFTMTELLFTAYAAYRDSGWAYDPSAVNLHEYYDCTAMDVVDATAGWAFTITAAPNLVACSCACYEVVVTGLVAPMDVANGVVIELTDPMTNTDPPGCHYFRDGDEGEFTITLNDDDTASIQITNGGHTATFSGASTFPTFALQQVDDADPGTVIATGSIEFTEIPCPE